MADKEIVGFGAGGAAGSSKHFRKKSNCNDNAGDSPELFRKTRGRQGAVTRHTHVRAQGHTQTDKHPEPKRNTRHLGASGSTWGYRGSFGIVWCHTRKNVLDVAVLKLSPRFLQRRVTQGHPRVFLLRFISISIIFATAARNVINIFL